MTDPWTWAAAGAAGLVSVTLLVGIGAAAVRTRRTRPWLVVLIEVNARRGEVTLDALRGRPPVDIALLLLSAVAYAGFWPGPGDGHVVWMALAVGQPLLGVVLLLVTRLVGRSGLMGGALVLSGLMLTEDTSAVAGWLGVVASVLLLVGDLATTGPPRRRLVPVLALGYGALVGWFGWVAVLLVD